jgi:hypothetical protein
MPSHAHEALLLLFRNRPTLAPEVLRDACQIALPTYSDVRLDSADLTDIQPAEYRADLVFVLLDERPVYGITDRRDRRRQLLQCGSSRSFGCAEGD